MSEEPTVVGTGVQEDLAPPKLPGTALEENEDAGEESDTYDDFEAEDNRDDDDDEDAGGDAYDPNEDGEEDEEEDEPVGQKPSNLTALLLNDPTTGGHGDDEEDADEAEDDYEEDGEYAEEADEGYEPAPVHANGNGKKRTIDDVNSEEGLEADDREVTAKKVKA
ncbi:hypothetical protein V5O48_001495 [Marasmius crinis-equi]|uniref:Uncharacterized protein n=1 Tax=Marasmius crinis-equi TaxID=585013 RepID=A0ABR3FYB0_9AGAR